MSSKRSFTPSIDSDASTKAGDLAALGFHSIDETLLDSSLSEKPVPEKDGDGRKPVKDRGTLIRPLAHFGTFQLKPETEKLSWISDHTSGTVHPDMRTISMLYNEDLTLPKAAENFIEQSLVLKEEARWERVKAAFYSIYPDEMKTQVFEALNGMLPREASQIITMKTLRFENEIVLKPKPKTAELWDETDSEDESPVNAESEKYCEENTKKFNKKLHKVAREYMKEVELEYKRFYAAKERLGKKRSSWAEAEKKKSPFWAKKERNPWDPKKKWPKSWQEDLGDYRADTQKCIEARLCFHHLDNAVARYEPRTGWIHVKTQLLHPGLEENRKLPKGISDLKLHSKFKIKGSSEERDAAVSNQMVLFEEKLRTLSTGPLATLESYHNNLLYYEYEIRVPYAIIKPSLCETIVKTLIPTGWLDLQIASEPEILPHKKQLHALKVYIRFQESPMLIENALVRYKNRYGCCLNCFSKNHTRVQCREEVYAFAKPLDAKN